MTTPLSDERRTEIRKRAEWEYALHAGQPRNEERGAILFLVGASIDLLGEVDRLRERLTILDCIATEAGMLLAALAPVQGLVALRMADVNNLLYRLGEFDDGDD